MKLIGHVAVCVIGAALLIGVPFLFTGGAEKLINGTDAVSSASVIVEAPSGNYTVLINRSMHKNEADLAAWHEFFSGGDIGVIFDDIRCVVAEGDTGALEMARSFMSRLPENQMTVTGEDAVLALSKAEHGRFDVLILSDEMADAYGAGSVCQRVDTDVIRISGGVS